MTSNISSPSSSKDSSINSQNKTNDADDFKEKTESNLCPFRLLWSFGINSEVPIINLTTENRTIIAYACSHAVIIYNYESKDVVNLQGHVCFSFTPFLYTGCPRTGVGAEEG
ncbi:cilia- and flagella-associated protein 251-like [Osmia bicornis bicornis]|uniref:cilia- and flagella-associated protein 251-like n=1 Tax=Osmia bicornis bicornis TaxID=1437191 RepID=UPI001EAF0C14|nr:cilia- and flagella-associated protein 251-like [Osmia bicornis bicornis]